MAAPPPQDLKKSRLANFLEYCQQVMPSTETVIEAVLNNVADAETTAIAHIRPNVFLIDSDSFQTLHEQQTNVTAMMRSSDIEDKEYTEREDGAAADGAMKLRSGNTLSQDHDNRDTDMIDLGHNESLVPGQLKRARSKNSCEVGSGIDDAEYEPPSSDGSEAGEEFKIEDGEVEALADVVEDDDADSDEERESVANDRRNPENYIGVSGWSMPIPIWEYLGRDYTDNIVKLLEAEPIQQPENCHTKLKHWQLTGVGKLLHLFETRHRGGILGDEQGLGKSLTAIAAIVADFETNEGKPYRGFSLIVTTKSCAPQWIGEIKRHYGSEMAKKAFFLNDPKVTANELLDGQYLFVVCTWQFVMNRYTLYQKNIDFFRLLAKNGRAWVEQNMIASDKMPLNVRHVNALFSHAYKELNLPIRHLVLDEAQFAKNVTTKTYNAVRHLEYERVLLLSGTFLANRWHDLFALVSLIPGHPFDNYQQFMKTFAHKEAGGYYSTPSVSKRNRLIKFLMAFTISRPVSVLNLPKIEREYHDFELTDDTEAEVAFRVRRYLALMSMTGTQQLFNRASSSGNGVKKALMQAVLAQLYCANSSLITPGKIQVDLYLKEQYARLKERFAVARKAAGGTVTMEALLAIIAPGEMTLEQVVSIEPTDELINVSLEQGQGEVTEVDGDVPEVIACNNQFHDEKAAIVDSNASDIIEENTEDNEQPDYKAFKGAEDRKIWLTRLEGLDTSQLLSSKVVCIRDLMLLLRYSHPDERVIVFSRYLKFLDILAETIRRDNKLSDMVPLQFNGTLSSEQRSFSQTVFNDSANRRPLFITAGSGGAGLNLTGGSQLIQCEPWWNENDELQAQSRAWRMGQLRSVHVYVIRGVNSLIDYVMCQCQAVKKTTNKEIMLPLRRKDDEAVIIPKQYQGGVGEH